MKKEKVHHGEVEYIETTKQFSGLKFHCPECDTEFHIDVAQITFKPKKIIK